MKYFKLIVMALVIAFTFGSFDSAQAQVVVKARIGPGYSWHGRHYNHRRAYWRHHHRMYRYY